MDDAKNKELHKVTLALYTLFISSIFLQFFNLTVIFGTLLMLFAFVLSLHYKARARALNNDTLFSHLRWMLRTFYISTGIFLPIAMVVATVAIVKYTDVLLIGANINADDSNAMANSIESFINNNVWKVSMIAALTFLPVIVWTLRRLVVGVKLLRNNKPIEKVKSWL